MAKGRTRLTIDGIDKLTKSMGTMSTKAAFITDARYRRLAYKILADSQEQVPVDTSTLQGTGGVAQNGFADYEIYYGTDYAIYVHERTDLTHADGKKAKYLQDPFEDAVDNKQELFGAWQDLIDRFGR